MKRPRLQHLKEWHRSNAARLDALGRTVESSLRSLLTQREIPFLNVSYRVKGEGSFVTKVKKKKYADPYTECTDLLGVRIITYIESDVDECAKLLRESFSIDESNSLDKRALLGVDKIGYRSVHFVASLGVERCKLPEFIQFQGLLFEVQVRTVLQHAWAEIEHDRNYKLAATLPAELERRLFLVAGVLELADREFNNLAKDIDRYADSVASNTSSGDLSDELNTPSLKVYCDALCSRFKKAKILPFHSYDELVTELREYGASKLSDIDGLITDEFLREYDRQDTETNPLGILRDAMMLADIKAYFKKAWKERWGSIDPDDFAPLSRKYGQAALGILKERNIDIERNEYDFIDLPDED